MAPLWFSKPINYHFLVILVRYSTFPSASVFAFPKVVLISHSAFEFICISGFSTSADIPSVLATLLLLVFLMCVGNFSYYRCGVIS